MLPRESYAREGRAFDDMDRATATLHAAAIRAGLIAPNLPAGRAWRDLDRILRAAGTDPERLTAAEWLALAARIRPEVAA